MVVPSAISVGFVVVATAASASFDGDGCFVAADCCFDADCVSGVNCGEDDFLVAAPSEIAAVDGDVVVVVTEAGDLNVC